MTRAHIFAALILSAATISLGVGALAQSSPPHPMAPATAGLTEPGQAAFAALSEVTAKLMADPATDWSTVDLTALRAHLVDMDAIFMRSRVASDPIPGGARFTVTGDDATAAAIQRMAGAHFAAMGAGAWKVAVVTVPGGEQLTVTSPDPADAAKIRGLGFFGLMSLGDHHKRHHLMLARSGSMTH